MQGRSPRASCLVLRVTHLLRPLGPTYSLDEHHHCALMTLRPGADFKAESASTASRSAKPFVLLSGLTQ